MLDLRYYDTIVEDDVEAIADVHERSASTISDCYSNDEDDFGFINKYLNDSKESTNIIKESGDVMKNDYFYPNKNNDSNYLLKTSNYIDNKYLVNQFESNNSKSGNYFYDPVNNIMTRLIDDENSGNNHHLEYENNSNTDLMTKITRNSSPMYLLDNLTKSEFYRPPSTNQDDSISKFNESSLLTQPKPLITENVDPSSPTNSYNQFNSKMKSKNMSNFISNLFVSNYSENHFSLNHESEQQNFYSNTNDAISDQLPDLRKGDSIEIGSFARPNHPPITKRIINKSKSSNLMKSITTYVPSNVVTDARLTQTGSDNLIFTEADVQMGIVGKNSGENKMKEPNLPDGLNTFHYVEEDVDNCLSNISRHVNLIIASKSQGFSGGGGGGGGWGEDIMSVMYQNNDSNNVDSMLTEMSRKPIYSDNLVGQIYERMKSLCRQLDLKLRQEKIQMKPKHQRRYTDLYNFNTSSFQNKSVSDHLLFLVQSAQYVSNECQFNPREILCRIFQLDPYDDVIKSFQNHSDRRLKAVANKMKCRIAFEGPLKSYDDSTEMCWNMRCKTIYHCCIAGSSKEAVEKCIKCLQDTFPTSCFIDYTNNKYHLPSKNPVSDF